MLSYVPTEGFFCRTTLLRLQASVKLQTLKQTAGNSKPSILYGVNHKPETSSHSLNLSGVFFQGDADADIAGEEEAYVVGLQAKP